MTLTDEELDALAQRLAEASFENGASWTDVAREAARWAAEQQGEVVWEYRHGMSDWRRVVDSVEAALRESFGWPVRAIRVIATTTKGQTNE